MGEIKAHIDTAKKELKRYLDDYGKAKLYRALTALTAAVEEMSKTPQPDVLGDCLTCGAKSGQVCYRHCSKTT